MTYSLKQKSCWILFDEEKKGSEMQCRGLAEALGLQAIGKSIPRGHLLQFVPRFLWFFLLSFGKALLKDIPKETPDIIISSGTRASVVAAFLKRKGLKGQKPYIINILNPRLPQSFFDLIITPEHDGLKGKNVISTLGSLHGLTKKNLKDAAKKYRGEHSKLKRHVVTVIIGGPGKHSKMSGFLAETLGQQLAHLHRTRAISLLVTFSRRTPEAFKEIFKNAVKRIPMDIYDPLQEQCGFNPYLAFLGLADYILVTADSISMVSEACFTGKPVQIIKTHKIYGKFKQFHDALKEKNATKPFKGSLQKWDVIPLDECARVIEEIKSRF